MMRMLLIANKFDKQLKIGSRSRSLTLLPGRPSQEGSVDRSTTDRSPDIGPYHFDEGDTLPNVEAPRGGTLPSEKGMPQDPSPYALDTIEYSLILKALDQYVSEHYSSELHDTHMIILDKLSKLNNEIT